MPTGTTTSIRIPFSQTTPIEKPEDCDCDKPGTLTDTLIGPLESFFGKEAQDDEIIGAESLPTTYQGWGGDGALNGSLMA